MPTQVTIRDVPEEDVAALKREAARRQLSLNSVLRSVITAEAEKIRRRGAIYENVQAMDELRARIAERAGGYVSDSTQLIREDRDSR